MISLLCLAALASFWAATLAATSHAECTSQACCSARVANIPLAGTTYEEKAANRQERCRACQRTMNDQPEDIPDGVMDRCEYCMGQCLHESLGEGVPLFCPERRKRGLSKRAHCTKSQFDMTLVFDTKDISQILSDAMATKQCLGGANCQGGTHGQVTASAAQMTFPPEVTTNNNPNNNGPTPKPGAAVTIPPVNNLTPAPPTSKDGGVVCAAGPPPKYIDRCGKCGGNNVCSPAAHHVLSLAAVVVGSVLVLL